MMSFAKPHVTSQFVGKGGILFVPTALIFAFPAGVCTCTMGPAILRNVAAFTIASTTVVVRQFIGSTFII